MVQEVATELQPGNNVDPTTTSAREADISCSGAPSKSALSTSRLTTLPIPALGL